MSKDNHFYGIDISKDTFDVYSNLTGHHQFTNDVKGFKKFLKLIDSSGHCVMEATGYYHYRLASFLFENKIAVSVENPLKIKRFIQMKLTKVKTDKADAKLIYEYAKNNDLSNWQVPNKEAMQLLSLLDTYQKQSTQLKNKIHGEEALGKPSKMVLSSLKRSLKTLQKEMKM